MAANERTKLEGIAPELLAWMHEKMVTIRLFEEEIKVLYQRNLMRGSTHLYIGEEAVAVGACAAADQRGLYHQHAPRTRPLHRQRRRCRPDDGGIAWQG